MRCSSTGVGARSSRPITALRTPLCPIVGITLTPGVCFSIALSNGVRSAGPPPSGLISTVVMPWYRIGTAPASGAIDNPGTECECASMKPGVTYLPAALMTRAALASCGICPTATIRSPEIPISALRHGMPVPSRTRPSRMITSNDAASAACTAVDGKTIAKPAAANNESFKSLFNMVVIS